VLNIFSENSCSFVVIPYIFSLCLGGYEVIMQNKANLRDTQMNVNYCFNKVL